MVQRAELLDAVLADLYGARRLLARGQLPAERRARPRGVPAARRRGRERGRPAPVHDRRRPRPRRVRRVEGHLRPDPGPLRRGLRDGEPPGGLPGAARAVPRGAPAPADAVLPGHAGRAGRGRAEHRRGPARRRAEPGHALGDRVRPGVRRLPARLPAARGQRPARARRAGVDAGARPPRAGRRHPAPRRLDLDGRPRAARRVAARRHRPAGVRAAGHGQRRQHHRLGRAGEPGAAAVPARALRAPARRAAAAALGRHLVVRRPRGPGVRARPPRRAGRAGDEPRPRPQRPRRRPLPRPSASGWSPGSRRSRTGSWARRCCRSRRRRPRPTSRRAARRTGLVPAQRGAALVRRAQRQLVHGDARRARAHQRRGFRGPRPAGDRRRRRGRQGRLGRQQRGGARLARRRHPQPGGGGQRRAARAPPPRRWCRAC